LTQRAFPTRQISSEEQGPYSRASDPPVEGTLGVDPPPGGVVSLPGGGVTDGVDMAATAYSEWNHNIRSVDLQPTMLPKESSIRPIIQKNFDTIIQ